MKDKATLGLQFEDSGLSVPLEERGKGISSRGESVGTDTVYRGRRGGGAKKLNHTWSKIMALEPSEGFRGKMIGSKLCLRRKWTVGSRSCEDAPGSVSGRGRGEESQGSRRGRFTPAGRPEE